MLLMVEKTERDLARDVEIAERLTAQDRGEEYERKQDMAERVQVERWRIAHLERRSIERDLIDMLMARLKRTEETTTENAADIVANVLVELLRPPGPIDIRSTKACVALF